VRTLSPTYAVHTRMSPTHTHYHTHILTHTHTITLTHLNTHSLKRTHTHTHTHTHTQRWAIHKGSDYDALGLSSSATTLIARSSLPLSSCWWRSGVDTSNKVLKDARLFTDDVLADSPRVPDAGDRTRLNVKPANFSMRYRFLAMRVARESKQHNQDTSVRTTTEKKKHTHAQGSQRQSRATIETEKRETQTQHTHTPHPTYNTHTHTPHTRTTHTDIPRGSPTLARRCCSGLSGLDQLLFFVAVTLLMLVACIRKVGGVQFMLQIGCERGRHAEHLRPLHTF
jgi:hypothetical protein